MNKKSKLITLSGLTIVVAGLLLLSACSMFSSSGDSARIDTLEAQQQATDAQVAALQQQVTDLQNKVNSQPVTTVPSTTITTATTTTRTTTTPTGPVALGTADITLSNLVFNPNPVLTGATISISVDVTNKSTKSGTYKVVMTEKMVFPSSSSTNLEYSDSVTFTPGEKKTITFTTSKDNPSGYSVQIGTLSGQYSVISPPPSTTSTTEQPQ